MAHDSAGSIDYFERGHKGEVELRHHGCDVEHVTESPRCARSVVLFHGMEDRHPWNFHRGRASSLGAVGESRPRRGGPAIHISAYILLYSLYIEYKGDISVNKLLCTGTQMARFNNYSPKTGNRRDVCRFVIDPETWKKFEDQGLKLGDRIRTTGTIAGANARFSLRRDQKGDPIKKGNFGKGIYLLPVRREGVMLDEKDLTDEYDVYLAPLIAVAKDTHLQLISTPKTVRRAAIKRKRRPQEAREPDGNTSATEENEVAEILALKTKMAARRKIEPSQIEIRISFLY
jgi:hypothetical protein